MWVELRSNKKRIDETSVGKLADNVELSYSTEHEARQAVRAVVDCVEWTALHKMLNYA